MKFLEAYAELLLEVGIGLQKGQNLHVTTEPYHVDFALLLEKIAYEKGARFVRLEFLHPKSKLYRANYSDKAYLDYVPRFIKDESISRVEEDWALIKIGGLEDPYALNDMDQTNHGITHSADMVYKQHYMKARMAGICTWCIGNMPTPGWAQQILGGEADEANKEKLWELMVPILRLDTPDPVQSWLENSSTIQKRAAILNNYELEYLHFEGPGSDLKVYLTDYSRFIGGAQKAKNGSIFIPNLPTEEFFTTPDFRKTHGRIAVTRPVEVLNTQVHGAWFVFEKGRVINYGADKGKEQLDAFFAIDEKARYLGEVALVDIHSPIYQSGQVFHDILYDENAACHIALGRGIGMAMPEVQHRSREELEAVGYNHSILHTDFMVGSEQISVTGYSRRGECIEIIKNGAFCVG